MWTPRAWARLQAHLTPMFKGKGQDPSIRPARSIVCFRDPDPYRDTDRMTLSVCMQWYSQWSPGSYNQLWGWGTLVAVTEF